MRAEAPLPIGLAGRGGSAEIWPAGPTLYFHASQSKELAQPSPAVPSVSPTLLSTLPNTVPLSGEVLYLAILWLEKGSVLSDRHIMHESAEKTQKR